VPYHHHDSMQFVRRFLEAGAIVFAGTDLFVHVVRVEGTSMHPTFNPGLVGPNGRREHRKEKDIVLVDRTTAWTYQYARGDVVTVKLTPDKTMVKRVVGLGGDWVRSRSDGRNGSAKDEGPGTKELDTAAPELVDRRVPQRDNGRENRQCK
jgi:signal peptidase I